MEKRDACCRVTLRKIFAVLRLKFEAGLSLQRISAATKVSKGAVTKYVQRVGAAQRPRARTTTAAGRSSRHRSPQRSALGTGRPTATGERIRSTPDLVMRNCFLGLGTLVSAAHCVARCWSGLDHCLPSARNARRHTVSASDSKMKMCN